MYHAFGVMLLSLLLATIACRETVVVVATPTPEPTAAPAPAATPAPTPASSPTHSLLPQPRHTPTPTPSPTPTPEPTSTPTPTPIPTPTPEPTPIPKPTLIFSDLNWPTAQIQNYIARAILEWGYGYETDSVYGGTVPLAEALARGDTNVTMEIWLPNQQEFYDNAVASGAVTSIGKSLEDNWQSAFIIPQYVADAHPGLRTPQDLKKPEYKELFATPGSNGKARMLTCLSPWECYSINHLKVEAYGLQDVVQLVEPDSDVALATEIRTAFERREPVLFYYWGPTILSNTLETQYGGFKILEEPEYSDACWETTLACDYPTAEVFIVVRTELLEEAPDAIEFLRKWDFHAGNQLAAESYYSASDSDFSEVAVWFLRNTTDWHSWVTPEARDKVLAALG